MNRAGRSRLSSCRRVLQFLGFALMSAAAWAQPDAWPNRPVRIIATSPPGGTVDLLARIVAEECTKTFGQAFVVENRPGANGNIGVDAVLKAPADGYMVFVTIPGVFSINQHLFKNMPFDPEKDIAPIAMLGESPLILVVPPSTPVQTFPQFLQWVRSHPGKLSYSSAGVGTTGHLGMELLKQMAGLDIVHVPHRGTAAAINDLLAGQVQMTLDNTTSALPHIRAGALRGLAVGEKERIASAPDMPTMNEAGVPGYEVVPWFGLGTRSGVPADIVARLNTAANKAMSRPENQKRLGAAGIQAKPMTQTAFAGYVRVETGKWGEIIRKSGASID
jgi:tripartite-type tricarboxylate transporter receptor subunit TctC